MEIDAKEYRGYLKDEYIFLQGQYEDFDKRSITFKGWVSSGAIAGLAISFSNNVQYTNLIPIFIIIISLTVWYLECLWKIFQYSLSYRIRVIEAYFRKDPNLIDKEPSPFQIYHSWFKWYVHDAPVYYVQNTASSSTSNSLAGIVDNMNYRASLNLRRIMHICFADFIHLPYSIIIILAIICVLYKTNML